MKFQTMITTAVIGMLMLSSGAVVNAQTVGGASQTTSNGSGTLPSQSTKQISDDISDRFRQLHDTGVPQSREHPEQNILNEKIQSIYRKPNKDEMKILAPDAQLLAQYQDFLKKPNTGIFKLNADLHCASNGSDVVAASENCLQYKVPGGGTAFSFRVRSYRIPRLSDLMLAKDVLKTDSAMQQGILVNLGDVPVEDITVQSNGLKYLIDFKPAAGKEDLEKANKNLAQGVKADGYIYSLGFYARKNTTFALRSIAYKSSFMRSVGTITYDEFQFDKRKDIVVAFRVVDIDPMGNVTLLWKELQQHDAPGIKMDKTDK